MDYTIGQLAQFSVRELQSLGYSRLAFKKAIGLYLNPPKEYEYMKSRFDELKCIKVDTYDLSLKMHD